MDFSLDIDRSTCIKCGKCVRVCPQHIFKQEKQEKEIGLQNVHRCISCGHCVAVCPTFSVLHSDFPPEKVHPIDTTLLPSPEQVMLLCKSRRSNRAFSSKPIPGNMLDQILEAAHRAPTASNSQHVEFTLITDPQKLQQIIDLTVGIFASLSGKLDNIFLRPLLKTFLPEVYGSLPLFRYLKKERVKGNDPILRNATALILIHTPRKYRFGCEDSNLAYQNGSLMAESLHVNQFYTGFLCVALKQDKTRRIEKLLGIEGTIHAGMALAMPQYNYPNYIDRKDFVVKKF